MHVLRIAGQAVVFLSVVGVGLFALATGGTTGQALIGLLGVAATVGFTVFDRQRERTDALDRLAHQDKRYLYNLFVESFRAFNQGNVKGPGDVRRARQRMELFRYASIPTASDAVLLALGRWMRVPDNDGELVLGATSDVLVAIRQDSIEGGTAVTRSDILGVVIKDVEARSDILAKWDAYKQAHWPGGHLARP